MLKNVYYLSILQKYIKSKLSFLYDQFKTNNQLSLHFHSLIVCKHSRLFIYNKDSKITYKTQMLI